MNKVKIEKIAHAKRHGHGPGVELQRMDQDGASEDTNEEKSFLVRFDDEETRNRCVEIVEGEIQRKNDIIASFTTPQGPSDNF